jgi:hypothetical protein
MELPVSRTDSEGKGEKPTVVVAAIARELASFNWAIGQEMRAPMTA